MISKHLILVADAGGKSFGVWCLAQGPQGKSQKIFYILEIINDDTPEWYIGKMVVKTGTYHNARGLTSQEVEHIGTFKDEKQNPLDIFKHYPEYFL